MKSKILGYLTALLLGASVTLATNTSIPWTAGQNTYKQSTLIPQENTRTCARFGLASNCSSANLVTAGCVAQACSAVTIDNNLYRNCTIFTLDAAGEALFDQDSLCRYYIANIANDLAADVALTKAAWKAANQTNKNTTCTTIGRPTGCHFYE